MPFTIIQEVLLEQFDAPREELDYWVEAGIDKISAGTLWVGDPLRPQAEEGCVVPMANGLCRTEAIGLRDGRRRLVSKLRVLPYERPASFARGQFLGEVRTESGLIGICDIANFAEASLARGSQEEILSDILYWLGQCNFGFITLRNVGTTGMSYLPIAGDGTGLAWELLSGGECVGMEVKFA